MVNTEVKVLVKMDKYSDQVYEVYLPDLTGDQKHIAVDSDMQSVIRSIAIFEAVDFDGEELPSPSVITEEEKQQYDYWCYISFNLEEERENLEFYDFNTERITPIGRSIKYTIQLEIRDIEKIREDLRELTPGEDFDYILCTKSSFLKSIDRKIDDGIDDIILLTSFLHDIIDISKFINELNNKIKRVKNNIIINDIRNNIPHINDIRKNICNHTSEPFSRIYPEPQLYMSCGIYGMKMEIE